MKERQFRTWGVGPYGVLVLHGGPGAPGETAPLARRLAAGRGVLEPLQGAPSLDGQVAELRSLIEERASAPVTLIGWSWGAMLGYIFAARCPALVGRLVLVGSGPYEDGYAAGIMETRLARLPPVARAEVERLIETLDGPAADKDRLLARLGALLSQADDLDPLPHDDDLLECGYEVYRGVWSKAAALRRSGRLLEMGRRIRCPVLAVHGDYDPHPAAGVRALSGVVADFRFVLLERCGHRPWLERGAQDAFFALLEAELQRSP